MENVHVWLLLHLPRRLSGILASYLMKKNGQGNTLAVREYYRIKFKVDIGLYTYGGCFSPSFNAGGQVVIGRYCSIAKDVHYFGTNHPMSHISTSAYFYNRSFGYDVKDVKREKLTIGNDVWIGHGTLIMSSCHYIGNGAVIGGGSIVTHDIPPYAIVAGNPARIIRYRFSEEEQKKLEFSRWWDLSPEDIMKCYDLISDVNLFLEKVFKEL